MDYQHCEHAWHIMPACFSIVTKTSVDDIIKFCGHDGSELVWPEYGDLGRLGFHTQEMIRYCLTIGYSVTALTQNFVSQRDNSKTYYNYSDDYRNRDFYDLLRHYYGVVSCNEGMCVWDGQRFYNPYSDKFIDFIDQEIYVFLVVCKLI